MNIHETQISDLTTMRPWLDTKGRAACDLLIERARIRNQVAHHFEDEGEWCLPTECHVGEDNE